MKKLSYIIPFNSSIDNISNLRKVIKWVNGFKGSELVVVEYDSRSSKLDIISEAFTHVFVKNDSTNFSKSWAYNIGLKNSSSDFIICGDSSTITNPDNIIKGLELLSEYDVVKPFSNLLDIQNSQIKEFKIMDETINTSAIGSLDSDDRVVHLCSNIIMFKRDSLLKMGGWEEKFKMDYFEEFQSHKVKSMFKWIELEGKGYTLPFSKPHNDSIVTSDLNTNNKLKTFPTNELHRYITTTYNNVGMKNRYE